MKKIIVLVFSLLTNLLIFAQDNRIVILKKQADNYDFDFKTILNINYYLDKEFIVMNPIERLRFGKFDNIISKKQSKILFYDRTGNLFDLSNIQFARISDIAPKKKTTLVLRAGNVRFNKIKKNLKETIDGQIIFKTASFIVKPDGEYTENAIFAYKENYYDLWTSYLNGKKYEKISLAPKQTLSSGNKVYFTYSLLNYRIFYCGDGILNGFNGNKYHNGTFYEECDYKDKNKENWGKLGCSCDCKKID